jgi:Ca-activated chloride channel family protein
VPALTFGLQKSGNVVFYDKLGNGQVAQSVRQIGNKSFFRKDGRWIESTLKPEEESNATVVTQFSDDYFALARAQTSEMNQYITMPDDVTVRLGTKVYRFQQAKQ